MTKIKVCALLACLLTAGSAMATPTVYVTQVPGYAAGLGGEYTLTPNAELGILLGSTAPFESFCLERDETVSPPHLYNVEISDKAELGGVDTDSGDPISDLTAYLYSGFLAGTLTGYDYTVGSARVASAGALQNVIWYLEGEIAWTFAAGSLEDQFYQAAVTAVADGWTNDGSVVVLNLYTVSDGVVINNQSMLGMVSTVPAPGAIVLGALGSSVVGFLRRRRML